MITYHRILDEVIKIADPEIHRTDEELIALAQNLAPYAIKLMDTKLTKNSMTKATQEQLLEMAPIIRKHVGSHMLHSLHQHIPNATGSGCITCDTWQICDSVRYIATTVGLTIED